MPWFHDIRPATIFRFHDSFQLAFTSDLEMVAIQDDDSALPEGVSLTISNLQSAPSAIPTFGGDDKHPAHAAISPKAATIGRAADSKLCRGSTSSRFLQCQKITGLGARRKDGVASKPVPQQQFLPKLRVSHRASDLLI